MMAEGPQGSVVVLVVAMEEAPRPARLPVTVTPLRAADYGDVQRIFQEAIDSGNSSFETAPAVSYDTWVANKYPTCCLVARAEGADEVVGWAALASTSARTCFQGVAELSVYIAAAYHGRGVATQLLDALIPLSEAAGIWTIQSGIFPENTASLTLHTAKYGFREVGRREKIGKMLVGPHAGEWRDIVLLERRSTVVGIH